MKQEAEKVLQQMTDEMPFSLSEQVKPYILEALELISKKAVDNERERIRKEIEEAKYPSNGYDYELGYNSGLDTALSLLSPTSKPTT